MQSLRHWPARQSARAKGAKTHVLFTHKTTKKINKFCLRVISTPREAEQKSFLVLFFKKERLVSPHFYRAGPGLQIKPSRRNSAQRSYLPVIISSP